MITNDIDADTKQRARTALISAADMIETRGKATGITKDDQGRVCALYAIRLSVENPGIVDIAEDALLTLIGRDTLISRWNDAHDQPTVVTTFRLAAEELA